MGVSPQESAPLAVLTVDGLQALLQALRRCGYRIIGPAARDQAIVYDDIESAEYPPRGWTGEQDGGLYRFARRDGEALFGYTVGPQSWERFLHLPTQRLRRTEPEQEGVRVVPEAPSAERIAFIGVRACELHAIAIQDRVFLGGEYVDPHYQARREGAFIDAVNCGKAGGTRFCASMNTGPKAEEGFDLALTELIGESEHIFLVEAGSDAGCRVLAGYRDRLAPPLSRSVTPNISRRQRSRVQSSKKTRTPAAKAAGGRPDTAPRPVIRRKTG